MLKTLSIWNFALIEHVDIDFSAGLNILTGETGAGKSILIDALGLILGQRTSVDYIRGGAEWLRVEGVFTVDGDSVAEFLRQYEIVNEDDILIVSRTITVGAKSTIRVNGCQLTLTALRKLGELLVDVHSQNKNQALFTVDNQFALLDNEPGIETVLAQYRQCYREYKHLTEQLEDKIASAQENARKVDMLRWQIDEIQAADLQEGEEEALDEEIGILSHAEKIVELTGLAHNLLENGDRNHLAIIASLMEVKKNIESLLRYDKALEPIVELLDDALCKIEQCSFDIRDYGDNIDYSPERLDKLQTRLDEIYRLEKKYGSTVEEILRHYERSQAELAAIENYDDDVAELRSQIANLRERVGAHAADLTQRRLSAAAELSAAVTRHLRDLRMPDGRLRIDVLPIDTFNNYGADQIKILFSANKGEELKDVAKVASGGEMSRLALALKTIMAAAGGVSTMVFDEIDTGIGGKTAQMVANRIAEIAAYKQVLCITHLPQIACMADRHLYINKAVVEDKTVTLIKELSTDEQLKELARMATGIDDTDVSLETASAMLANAKKIKQGYRKTPA